MTGLLVFILRQEQTAFHEHHLHRSLHGLSGQSSKLVS